MQDASGKGQEAKLIIALSPYYLVISSPNLLISQPAGLLILLLAFLLLVALLAYWQLVMAEGVYLGPRVVSLLYDWTARRYNAIKCYSASDEAWFLGAPLARALSYIPAPLVLDVACGTGRLPKTLLGQPDFGGKVIGLDASRAMLAEAARALGDRAPLIWQSAAYLPFDDATFDAVTCLEALEFMPDTSRALAEIARVLRPGGVLLATNRIGPWAKWIPGHTMSAQAFEDLLDSLGFEQVKTQAWQVEYDLVWAIHRGSGSGGGARPLPQVLNCPHCGKKLARTTDAWRCDACKRAYPVATDGIIEMMNR
jgi:SAM-dependent methyltransferase